MTMLDRMRRHKSWLKWSLALVVVAFVIFYVPAFLNQTDSGSTGAPSDMVASVDGRRITVADFRRSYQTQVDAYRSAYGGNLSDQMLKQLGLERQILQQLVEREAQLSEAKRLKLSVSDDELAQYILAMPAFQENGRFVGDARFAAMLRMNRPPMTVEQFQESLRSDQVVRKLYAASTDWIAVTDQEVAQEFQRRNEKVKIEMVSVPADKFRSAVTVTDADLAAWFEGHKEQYRVGERRKIRYLLVDVDGLRGSAQPTPREVERSYNENVELYSTPEQVRASQILFKTAGKKADEVKARADQVLKEIKAGGDFAALAKKYSDDEATAKQGGDLDFFPKGKLSPEVDEAAFKLNPGEVSDVVKSPAGFAIFKVTDKKPAATRPLDEVRPQIVDQLAWEKASAKAAELAASMEKEIAKPADLDKAAATHHLKVQESGFFTREEPVLGLGASPQATAEAFSLKIGEVSGGIQVSRGYVFLSPVSVEGPRLPKLDEVTAKVKEDVTKEKAKQMAREKAAALVASLKGSTDLAKAAKAAGLDLKTTELLPRDSPLPEIGVSPQVDAASFALPAGAVGGPVDADNAVVVFRVIEHRQPTPFELAAGREQLKSDMLTDRRERFFAAYMQKARQRMKVEVNRENLQKVIGQ